MKTKTLYTRLAVVLIISAMFFSCAGPKTTPAKKTTELYYKNIHVLAGNDDTVNVYRLAFTYDNKFLYKIVNKDGPREVTEFYDGTLQFSADTIYLKYNKGARPKGLTTYLIVEASGNYFIQYFTDGRKRMFLRTKITGGADSR